MLAIGGTDQNVVFRRGFSLPALAIASILPCLLIIGVEPLEEAQQHRQQSARDLIHLIIIATCGQTVDLRWIHHSLSLLHQ